MTLACTNCERELPLDAFWRCLANTHRQQRQRWCKDCLNEHRGTDIFYTAAPLLRILENLGYRSQRTQAEACGVTTRTIVRWRGGKGLRSTTADRVATALGLHRSAIW